MTVIPWLVPLARSVDARSQKKGHVVGLAGCCWWSSRGQDSAAQEFSKLNFRRQFSNRRREGKGRGKAQSGQRKLSLQQENLLSRSPSPSLLRSISWQWHRSRRLQKSCNNVTNFFVGALSLCRAAVRILFAFPAHFPAHSPLKFRRPVLHGMVPWIRLCWVGKIF